MALGSDHNACTVAFVEAMRARLVEKDPSLGENVDDPDVQKNLAALGLAVYRIATELSNTASDDSEDPAFWAWLADTQAWLVKLSTWQVGVVQAFTSWAPATAAEVSLRNLVRALPPPGLPPAPAPVRLRGRIE